MRCDVGDNWYLCLNLREPFFSIPGISDRILQVDSIFWPLLNAFILEWKTILCEDLKSNLSVEICS